MQPQTAVMRNPVTNMAAATDISRWCYSEVFGTYHSNIFRGHMADELQVMSSKSPEAHASNVKTPTMIALGVVDLRMATPQGLECYQQAASLPRRLPRT